MIRSQPLRWRVIVYNAATGLPVAGVASNLTANLAQNNGPRSPLVNNVATELEDGYYEFLLDSNETNADKLDLYPQSTVGFHVVLPLPTSYSTIDSSIVAAYNAGVLSLEDQPPEMAIGVRGQAFKWKVFLSDGLTGLPITGAASSLSARLSKDDGPRSNLTNNSATELEDGYYYFTLTPAETDAVKLDLFPESTIASSVAISPLVGGVYTAKLKSTPTAGTIPYTSFGSMYLALEYFNNRLYSDAWDNASIVDKRKALIAATRIIDTLNFKQDKTDPNQPHEFPRGGDKEVPATIEQACYEIAICLLDGRDPDLELEALGISSQGIESVRTTYSRNQVPIEHLINGVPSPLAWRLLRPFLRDDDSIQLIRV